VPKNISIKLDSFFTNLEGFVTYQLWLISLYFYFWPTKSNIEENLAYTRALTMTSESSGYSAMPSTLLRMSLNLSI